MSSFCRNSGATNNENIFKTSTLPFQCLLTHCGLAKLNGDSDLDKLTLGYLQALDQYVAQSQVHVLFRGRKITYLIAFFNNYTDAVYH